MDFPFPEYNLELMLPEIFLFVWALVVITVDLVTKRKSGTLLGYLAMGGLVVTGGIIAAVGFNGHGVGFGSMFYVDPMTSFFRVLFVSAAFMTIGCSFGTMRKRIENHRGEFLGLILLSTVGMMFLAASRELVSLYVSLELATIPLFVLVAFFKDDKRSVEAGVKYLIMGAFSSALLLYGMSILYGLTGTTEINQILISLSETELRQSIQESVPIGPIMLLAILPMLAGLGFKLALPPFHQWAPDVYEGAPTPITAFLSIGSKAAGLVAFFRLVIVPLYPFFEPYQTPIDWGMLVGLMAGAAMIVGNVMAVRQGNIKRMLAYSSIAHAGYIMIGMLSLNQMGLGAVGFYMFAYMFANMGVFAWVTVVEDKTGSCEIRQFAGLAKSAPYAAATLTVFLLSLTGIPPLAGFMGKYYLFAAAIKAAGSSDAFQWLYWVVGVGLLTSVIALYYYANIVRTMFFSTEETGVEIKPHPATAAVIAIGLVGVLVFGIYPEPFLQFASGLHSTFILLAP